MAFSEFLGILLRGAYLGFHRRMQAHFSRHGVTADQFVVLSFLAEEEDITQKQLTARSYSDANTITAILNRLEQKKLVERRRCTDDGRARRIVLTAKGRSLHAKLAQSATALHDRLEKTLRDEERVQIKQWLHRAIAETRPPNK